MQKIYAMSCLCLMMSFSAFSQVARIYYTTNDQDVTEYLLYHLKENSFTYYSSVNPSGVLLEIKKQTNYEYLLSFPGEADIYEVKLMNPTSAESSLTCLNPKDELQFFYTSLHNFCFRYGQGNAMETLYTSGPPPFYIYYSSKYPQGVLLNIVGGDMTQGLIQVSFPGDTKKYELIELENQLSCKNPDGSIQKFRKIDQE